MTEPKQTVNMTPDEYVEYMKYVRLMNDAETKTEVRIWFRKAMEVVDRAVARREVEKASEEQSPTLAAV